MRYTWAIKIVFTVTAVMTLSCNSGQKEPSENGQQEGLSPETGTQGSSSGEFRVTEQPPVRDDEATAGNGEMFREACLNGMSNEVSNYLQKGVDPETADAEGRSGLMLASYNGHTGIVEMLLDRKVKVNRADAMGRTALMFASTGHFPETVEVLLSHGANPNMTDFEEGFTALMFAAAEGNREVVKLLLDHGADPDLKDTDGDTAGAFARQNGHLEVAEMLGS